ncbi:hypothetical protein Taro_032540 [Colocasia esculenta]|uniref:Uncharacterized protein n=1 Tax=Colocasia esculenta TaxID=4460 RepID=A0A843W271_COLES|nr:hypothetical protein [Colocasia esculenta]
MALKSKFKIVTSLYNKNTTTSTTSTVKRTRGPISKSACKPCQPVGEEASKLAEVLGLYARNDNYFQPYKEWREQSKQSLNDVMKELLARYPKKLGIYLCNTKKIQRKYRKQKRNKKNCAEEQATHTLGAKSIARHHHEQREKLGDSYSTIGAYVKAYQTRSGEYPNEYTRGICEKAIATCEERNFTTSSDPSVLNPILDAAYNGHHKGYERGRGLGWSRVAWSHNMANETRNDNIRRLTVELENTQSELQNAMTKIQGWRLQVAGWNITLSSHKLIAFSSP